MAPPKKRPRAAFPLADLVGKAVGDAFAKQGFAAAEIVTHWQEIVGDELAKRSEPVKLVWPRRDDPDSVGVLTVRVEGAYALEIQHLQPVVIERVNRYFGWCCVGRLQSGKDRLSRAGKAPCQARNRRRKKSRGRAQPSAISRTMRSVSRSRGSARSSGRGRARSEVMCPRSRHRTLATIGSAV